MFSYISIVPLFGEHLFETFLKRIEMIALESRTATEHQVETIVKKCKSVSFSYFQLYNSISILNDPAVQQFIDFELDEDKCRCLADEQRKRRKSIFSVKRKNSCHHLIFVLFLIQQTSNNINIQTYLSQKFAEGTNFISLWKGLTRSYKSEQAYWKKKEGNKKLGRKKRQ